MTGMAGIVLVAMVLPFPRRRPTANQAGKVSLGQVVRKACSRLINRFAKSHCLNFGPIEDDTGCGSIIVKCRAPPGARHRLIWRRNGGISVEGSRAGIVKHVTAEYSWGGRARELAETETDGTSSGWTLGKELGDKG